MGDPLGRARGPGRALFINHLLRNYPGFPPPLPHSCVWGLGGGGRLPRDRPPDPAGHVLALLSVPVSDMESALSSGCHTAHLRNLASSSVLKKRLPWAGSIRTPTLQMRKLGLRGPRTCSEPQAHGSRPSALSTWLAWTPPIWDGVPSSCCSLSQQTLARGTGKAAGICWEWEGWLSVWAGVFTFAQP